VSVVFCVAVIFGWEEVLADGSHAGGGGCEERGEVGCHCGLGAAGRGRLVIVRFGLGYLYSIRGVCFIDATSSIGKLK
jgi:hypothetical protein